MTEKTVSVPQLRKDVTIAVIAGILRDSDKMWATLDHYEPAEKYKHIAESIYNTFQVPNQENKPISVPTESRKPPKPVPVGWFESEEQTVPAYDPPRNSPCPICNAPVTPETVKTISFRMDDERSYFYRMHRVCYAGLNDQERSVLDETMMLTAKGIQ